MLSDLFVPANRWLCNLYWKEVIINPRKNNVKDGIEIIGWEGWLGKSCSYCGIDVDQHCSDQPTDESENLAFFPEGGQYYV